MAEPVELKEARRRLAQAENDLGCADALVRLSEGLALLDGIIVNGVAADAATALNLATSYASRIYAQIDREVAQDPQMPEPQLEHFFKVVLAFDQVSVPLPPAATDLKVAVVRQLIERYYEGHSPEQKRRALEELAQLSSGSR